MHFVLPFVVFTSGAVVMILELAGARIIAPYLGTSILVWTSLIGVFLAALSLGYYAGGRIADKYPSPRTLAFILFVASALVALCAHFEPFLRIATTFADVRIGALYAVAVLFAPATMCLGMVTPLAVKLSLKRIEETGRTVGNLYAFSNTGSIVGTFLGGFVLISYLDAHTIVIVLSLALLVLACIVTFFLRTSFQVIPALTALCIVASALFIPHQLSLARGQELVADINTQYGRHWVFDTYVSGKPTRVMTNILGGYQSMMYKDDTLSPPAQYLQFFDSAHMFHPHASSALMIGGSAYVYPRHYLAQDSSRTMTVVEIDSGVTDIARKYFGLTDDPQLTIIHEDGRVYLNKNTALYDIIFLDAFRDDLSIPFHLTTSEAIERMREALTKDGLLLTNVVGALEGKRSDFLRALYITQNAVFPHVALYRIDKTRAPNDIQNFVLIASNTPLEEHGDVSSRFPRIERIEDSALATTLPVLTDTFAPVERYFLGW